MPSKGRNKHFNSPSPDIGDVITAFSEDQVERIIGLKKTRLRYWSRTNFLKPSFSFEGVPSNNFYSFKDIVALRTLEMLRVQNQVPLQHLRKVADKLSHLKDALWTQTTLYVRDRKVVIVNSETGQSEEVVSGQYIFEIPLARVVSDTRADVIKFARRPDATSGQVSRTRAIAGNAWVVAGTRIPVDSIRRLHEDGYSEEKIIEEYPDLTPADVKAALQHKSKNAA